MPSFRNLLCLSATFLLVSCGGGDDSQAGACLFASACSQTNTAQPISSGNPDRPLVFYDVTGNGTTAAALTFTDAQGTTQQIDVLLPWSTLFTGQKDLFLYLSAQNKQANGSVSVSIRLNRSSFRSDTASGGFAIATASGTCC